MDKDKVSLESLLKDDATTDKDKDKTTSDLGILKKIWDKPSGKKAVSDYSEHSLNWDGKDSTGKIIRGLEGLFTNLDKAVIDVFAGTVQKIGEFFKGITNKDEKQRR